jgi:hypothetical protein
MFQPFQSDANRRRDQRVVTVFKVAKLVVGRRESLCIIRNVSPEGAKIETGYPLEQGDRAAIEFRSDRIIEGTVRWNAAGFAGVEFDRRVDLPQILAGIEWSPGATPGRAPRFDAALPILLVADDRPFEAQLANISLAGAAVTLGDAVELSTGDIVELSIEGLEPMKGEVRWQRRGMVGLRFLAPIHFRVLADWLGAVARRHAVMAARQNDSVRAGGWRG